MRFKTGDKIKIMKPFLRMRQNHVGEIGTVTELRSYCRRICGNKPTHYVVKFNCFKIPHIYMQSEIEDSCDKIG